MVPGDQQLVINPSRELHRRIELSSQLRKSRLLGPLADDDEARAWNRAAADRLDGRFEPHPVPQAPDGDHHERLIHANAHSPPRRALIARDEALGVDTGRDPTDPRRIDAIALNNERGEGL